MTLLRAPGWRTCQILGLLLIILWTPCPCRAYAVDPSTAKGETASASDDDLVFFERKIRPLLAEHCYECHAADAKTLQGGLRLDTRSAMLSGGDSGPAVVPGEPEQGTLLDAVRFATFEMPPTGKLPEAQIALLEEWIRRGAPMPADDPTTTLPHDGIDFDAAREFWSFRPLMETSPPVVSADSGLLTPIDAYVVSELEKHGLSLAPPANRPTFIRRASFDLLGLPPSIDDVEQFAADDSPDAYPRLVERLLASPHYGERWGRHWLDLTRYSDKTASWLSSLAQAWHYRDWVATALNDDLPYNEFVRRQLAADQFDQVQRSEMAALGFLGLSPAYWKELKLDKEVIKGTVAEEWEERVDAIGRTFLGLTIACARCHDHKYDPISTADYYALAGVVANTRLIDRPIVPDEVYEKVEQARAAVASLQDEITKLEAATPVSVESKAEIEALRRQIKTLEETTPHYHTALAHAVDDAALFVEDDGPDATKLTYKPGETTDLHIQIRGNPSNLGPMVPRRFLTILSDGTPEPFATTNTSGRLELANAIFDDAAPLAARVIVNRIWAHHFGRGIVETTSDFGLQGSPPSHPELLDYLARRLIDNGWSLKALHREIMLSAVYQQSSTAPVTIATVDDQPINLVDPENCLLSRMHRKRLEVEAWRDTLLAVTGTLDRHLGGPPLELKNPANIRRTFYGLVDRYELDDLLRLFDFPDPLGHSPRREPTTTPLQQLLVLNSPFMQRQAELLAERLLQERPADLEAQIELAYCLLYSRLPTQDERRVGMTFLKGGTPETLRQYAQVLLGSNELLFVD